MKVSCTIPFFLVELVLLSSLSAQSVSQWRGPNRDGIYPEKNLAESWPANGLPLLWRYAELGNGYGSPVVSGSRIFVNGEVDSTSHLFSFDLKGSLLWKSPFGKEFTGRGFSSNFPGNRSTPTVVGDLVYAASGTGVLACFDASSGAQKWAVDLIHEFNGFLNEFGYSESPLIDGSLIFCTPSGKDAYTAALDRFTGKTVWTSPSFGDTISFCSPMLIQLPSRKVLVNCSTYHIFALDAATGEFLWKQKQDSVVYGEQGNTPVFSGGYLYYVAGDGNGAVKLQLSPDGKGYREIWRNRSFRNAVGGFVLMNNTLYGTSSNKKMLAFDATSGMLSDSLRLSSGTSIAADGKIYCYTDKGDMSLITFENGRMKEAGKFRCEKGSKEAMAHPAIGEGILLVRHGKLLLAYQLK